MSNRRIASVVALAAALALLTMGAGAAATSAPPQYRETDKRYEIANGHVAVWFQGKKPLLKVFPAGNESAAYEVHVTRVAEFVDADGDGAYDADEAVAFINLARADDWRVEVSQDAGRLDLTLSLDGRIQAKGPGGVPLDLPTEDRRANVTLAFRIHQNATAVPTTEGLRALAATEVKFDLAVDGWDWIDAERGRLALLATVPVGDNATATRSNETARVDVAHNDTRRGHLAWLETAEVTTGNNTTTASVVPAFHVAEGAAHVSFAYNASGYDRLLHDPTVGVAPPAGGSGADAQSDDGARLGTPAPGAALLAGALAAAAAFRRRS